MRGIVEQRKCTNKIYLQISRYVKLEIRVAVHPIHGLIVPVRDRVTVCRIAKYDEVICLESCTTVHQLRNMNNQKCYTHTGESPSLCLHCK